MHSLCAPFLIATRASLDEVRISCDGELPGLHTRALQTRLTITDPAHVDAAGRMRQLRRLQDETPHIRTHEDVHRVQLRRPEASTQWTVTPPELNEERTPVSIYDHDDVTRARINRELLAQLRLDQTEKQQRLDALALHELLEAG